jgi:flagellar motor switch protein FliN
MPYTELLSAAASEASPASTVGDEPAVTRDLRDLPLYSRHLLRVRVPVAVTLAHKKQPVGAIVQLVPGSIIQFNKSCDEMLELEISGKPIGLGECVKVGDKFGLRLTSILLPNERFAPVQQ